MRIVAAIRRSEERSFPSFSFEGDSRRRSPDKRDKCVVAAALTYVRFPLEPKEGTDATLTIELIYSLLNGFAALVPIGRFDCFVDTNGEFCSLCDSSQEALTCITHLGKGPAQIGLVQAEGTLSSLCVYLFF